MVERLVANEKAAGSSPVPRSFSHFFARSSNGSRLIGDPPKRWGQQTLPARPTPKFTLGGRLTVGQQPLELFILGSNPSLPTQALANGDLSIQVRILAGQQQTIHPVLLPLLTIIFCLP